GAEKCPTLRHRRLQLLARIMCLSRAINPSRDLKLAVVAETMQPGCRSAMLLAATGCHRAWYSAGAVDERGRQGGGPRRCGRSIAKKWILRSTPAISASA